MTIYVCSDTHFGHKAIIGDQNRPFSSTHEMDKYMIDKWNSIVLPGDTVYFLGDFAFGSQGWMRYLLLSLAGEKHLIAGNHDKGIRKDTEWTTIQDYLEIRAGGKKVILCHYPFENWNGKHHGTIHFHGHSHGKSSKMMNRLDVGVDCLPDYAPMEIEAAIKLAERQRKDGGF